MLFKITRNSIMTLSELIIFMKKILLIKIMEKLKIKIIKSNLIINKILEIIKKTHKLIRVIKEIT
jgi:hypothetical protein